MSSIYAKSWLNSTLLTILEKVRDMKAQNYDPTEICLSPSGLQKVIDSFPSPNILPSYWGLPVTLLGMKITENPILGDRFFLKTYIPNSEVVLKVMEGKLP